MTLQPSGFDITTPGNFTTTAGAANTNVVLCAARLNALTLNAIAQQRQIRKLRFDAPDPR